MGTCQYCGDNTRTTRVKRCPECSNIIEAAKNHNYFQQVANAFDKWRAKGLTGAALREKAEEADRRAMAQRLREERARAYQRDHPSPIWPTATDYAAKYGHLVVDQEVQKPFFPPGTPLDLCSVIKQAIQRSDFLIIVVDGWSEPQWVLPRLGHNYIPIRGGQGWSADALPVEHIQSVFSIDRKMLWARNPEASVNDLQGYSLPSKEILRQKRIYIERFSQFVER